MSKDLSGRSTLRNDGTAAAPVFPYVSAGKRRKLDAAKLPPTAEEIAAEEARAVSTVMVQFSSPTGEQAGPQLEVPLNVSAPQMTELINQLLENDEALPYSFFHNEEEILQDLKTTADAQQASTEQIFNIVYQPQAVFRVKAVTRCSATIPGHTEAVLHVNFSPDGKQLASGSGDTTVRLWDVNTCTPKATLKGHRNWVLAVSWSPNGEYVASGGMDGEVRIWRADGGEKDTKSAGGQDSGDDEADDAAADGDGDAADAKEKAKKRKAAPKSFGKGKVHGAMVCKPLKGHKKWITGLAWEPMMLNKDCTRVASSSKDGSIKIWDIRRGICLLSLTGHTAAVKSIKWGGSGLLYSASQDRTIKVWETTQGKLVRTLNGHAHWVNCLSMNTEYALRIGPYDENGRRPTNDADLTKAVAACRERYDKVLAETGGDELLVSGSDDFTLFVWSPTKSKKGVVRCTGHQQPVNYVLYSPNGLYIASASFDNSVRLWDGITGKFITTFRGHVESVYQVCWSADSRLLCSGSKDSTMKVWEVKTKKLKRDLPGHADEVFAVDWSPDGIIVASGSKDRNIKLWRN
jgi:ribosome assembly protein 4